MIVVYALVKLLVYSLWCCIAVRIVDPAAATLRSAAGLGALRWTLGLVFGLAVFVFAGSIDQSDAARLYLLIYTPIRAVEWTIMAFIIGNRRRQPVMTLPLWCAWGIVVSFLTDLLSPDGVQGRFCVGRCLC